MSQGSEDDSPEVTSRVERLIRTISYGSRLDARALVFGG